MSQIGNLEQYNRRDNVRVFGPPCESNTKGIRFFLDARKKVDQAVRFAKKKFFFRKLAGCIGDSRQVFQVFKEVSGNRVQSKQLSSLKVDRYKVCEYTEIANAFDHHFVYVGPKFAESLPVKTQKTDQRAHQLMQFFRTEKRMPEGNSTAQKQTFIWFTQY